ncbi:dihydrodipicolinate synthase family protein [Arhodomonas aquaeolei]|uniref:dihydrodipicolinate synthase family protein n=1 Tax=Arhodomonas aquaeolei TaxID=2369 RepID=UPI002167146A|nr:dihydrodipicolinate synthase family protein [Arhodomonas aquaeolei]MCS4503790.1 dihydrodipicolinate synthase family protein [Arhodomonas aquaeolei]
MRFEGVYTPIITPYLDDYSVDWEGFERVVEHLVESGVHGIITAGTTGEYYAQSREERLALMKRTKELVSGRVPVIAGVGALRTEDAEDYARAAQKAGVDAVLLGAPYYAMPTERELVRHALSVDRAADLPVMLYNFPSRTGVNMGREFLDRVGRSGNFCAIKEASGDPTRLHMLAREYPHIQVSCGMDDQALEFFAWGARSWVCGASNFLPREHIALWRACVVDNDFEEGRRLMKAFLPLLELMEGGGKFVQNIKHGCLLEGMPAGPPRKPLRGLTKEEKRELATIRRTLKAAFTTATGQANGDIQTEGRGRHVAAGNA